MRLVENPTRGGFRGALVVLAVAASLSACASPSPAPVAVAPPPAVSALPPHAAAKPKAPSFTQTGIASWYTSKRKHARTADGERLVKGELTAAHRWLPMNTIVRVKNLDNGLSVRVRINDRGPYVPGRVIDVSPAAANDLGMKKAGLAPVRLEVYPADQINSSSMTASAN